jgi:imidazolonepropionase-like amidohydrolase
MKTTRPAIWATALLTLALAGGASAQPKPGAAAAKPAAAKPAAPAAAKTKAPGNEAQEKTTAIVGATVYTGDGEPIEDAVVLVAGGKIKSVGKGLAVPAGAETVQAKGMVVTPGLVDATTQVGIREVDLESSANDESASDGRDRVRAAYRAVDAYNPLSAVIPVTRLGGLTSVGVVPTGGLVSGQSAWADLTGETATDAVVSTSLAIHVHLEAGADPQGGSRAAALRAVREAFDDARFFQKNKAAWEKNQSRSFSAGRLDLEALTLALGTGKKGAAKVPVVFHTNRASTILSALAVAKEFDLTPVIAGGAEAWRVKSTLAKGKVPVIVYPFTAGPETFDMLGARDDNAALLHAAGVPVSISSGETQNARKLRQAAGNAVRAGLPHTAAVAAITRAPADALGMGDRYGTLAPGKVANLVLWSGDPLETQTRVLAVYIRGQKQSMESRQTRLFQKYRGVVR